MGDNHGAGCVSAPNRSGIPLARVLKRFGLFALGLILGIALSSLKNILDEKLLQLPHGPFVFQVESLWGAYMENADVALQPCEWKVERLHKVLQAADRERVSVEAGQLVASILLDGRDCNCDLLRYIHSQVPLPAVTPIGFRFLAHDSQWAGDVAKTEGELMLWMLDRLNPDDRFTLNMAQKTGASAQGYSNPVVSFYWYQLAGDECDQ